MARALVIGIKSNFGTPVVADDATNGWVATYQVVFTGAGAPNGGFDLSEFEVHFADSQTVLQQENAIRDACRVEAARLGIPDSATMVVTGPPIRRF